MFKHKRLILLVALDFDFFFYITDDFNSSYFQFLLDVVFSFLPNAKQWINIVFIQKDEWNEKEIQSKQYKVIDGMKSWDDDDEEDENANMMMNK